MNSNYVIMSDILALYKADQISEGQKVKYFVSHPDEEASAMYATTEASFKTLRSAFASKSAPQLKLDYYDLYHLSLEVLNKRRKLNYEDYEEIITRHAAAALSPSGLLDVWDNYIYYATKQTDLEALEICSNLLLAHFWLNKIIAPDTNADMKVYQQDLKRKLNAQIIFPNFLMTDRDLNTTPESESPGLIDIKKVNTVKKALKAIKAKAELEELEALEKDLTKARTKYNRVEGSRLNQYNKEYEQAYNEYIEQVEGAYFTVSEEGDEDDPAIPEGGIVDPSTLPPAPVYDYTPLEELDISMLDFNLSSSSKKAFNSVLEDDMTGFDHVFERVAVRKMELSRDINENTQSSNQLISVGGVPVRPSTGGEDVGLYGIETICLDEEENIWKFVVALYVKNIRSIGASLKYANAVIGHDTPVLDFKSSETSSYIVFSNGIKIAEPVPENLYLQITYNVLPRRFKVINIPLVLQVGKENVNMGETSGTGGSSEGDDDELFSKPNLYGVTRLGVGEYLKIDQQLCCYAPGEVSHIENVMAREIREKTTKLTKTTEVTETSEITFESEQSTDTSSTERNELSAELSAAEQQSRNYNNSTGGGFGSFSTNMSLSFGNSKEKSYSQASTKSQELVQKAVERIVSKTRQERVKRIVHEYVEENKHGYDNRKGENHINGVYRWVDKIYKNRLVNYGIRLMYEFMIPEPASLHHAYIDLENDNSNETNANQLNRPVDPRTSKENTIDTFEKISAINSAYWANAFGIEIDTKPPATSSKSGAYSGEGQRAYTFNDIEISEGYQVESINFNCSVKVVLLRVKNFDITIFDRKFHDTKDGQIKQFDKQYTSGKVPISISVSKGISSFTLNVVVHFKLTQLAENEWKKTTFDKIIKGYEKKLSEFEASAKSEQKQAKEKLEINPNFYREIETSVIKKNCISYLYDQMGVPPKDLLNRSFTDHHINRTKEFENYVSTVKFFEQAFEWEIMSYMFYPFYWADKEQWEKLYYEDVDDLLFRNFLQSGMARVIVSVRPGFEDAVMWYMKTGQIWSGGNPPVMSDEMYLSIVDELAGFVPETVVDEWEVRIPSALTILQTKGVELGTGSLPCYCDEETSEIFTESLNKIGDGTIPEV